MKPEKQSLSGLENPIRILSIDGGGILGIIPLVLMQRLRSSRKDFFEKVDLFAGTSTGGIIALSLAGGTPVDTIREFYEEQGPCIFTRPFLRRLNPFGTKYDNSVLQETLQKFLGSNVGTFNLAKRVLIPAFDLDNEDPDSNNRHWKPKFFSNYPGDADNNVLVWKVAMATSAAPTYFPSFQGFIDGGMIANNPSLAAVAKALRENPDRGLPDVRLLSFAAYRTNQYVKGNKNFGLLGVRTIVDILLNGSERVVDYECRELLGDAYCRVCAKQQPGVKLKLDDFKKISTMTNIAEMTDLRAVGDWLDKNW
jgi:patatin-like phospholipase/acyl hydrolase